MEDIARLAGVSKPTVSRVMKGSALVTQKTRERVLEVARRHGYSVNDSARRLWQNRANTVAVVLDLPSLPHRRVSQPFHFEIVADLLRALTSLGQDALLVSSLEETAETYRAIVASKRADGIIFLGQGRRRALLDQMSSLSVPFVVWGAKEPGSDHVTVGSDNREGGRLAGRRFSELGRKSIAFVGPLAHPEFEQRCAGLQEGFAGGRPAIVEPEDLSYEASREAFQAWLDRAGAPDGIFCGSDTIAMAVLSVLRTRRIRVPSRTSVIGYDDIPEAAHHLPPLTTIRQDTALAGELLVKLLMEQIEGRRPASVTLPTELLVRAT